MRQNNAGPQEEKPVRGGLLTIDEAAGYIRMGKTTLYECINDGIIPFFSAQRREKYFWTPRTLTAGCGKANPRPAR
jgi:excisionase family DNA binding protein